MFTRSSLLVCSIPAVDLIGWSERSVLELGLVICCMPMCPSTGHLTPSVSSWTPLSVYPTVLDPGPYKWVAVRQE